MGCLCPKPKPVPEPAPTDRTEPQFTNIDPPPPLQQEQSFVQLHTPIYVATETYQKTNADQLSFEQHDEMELLEEVNAHELRVVHLRTGRTGLVPRRTVRIDVDTPLRLATSDHGVVRRCLLHYNVPGAYLIRRSTNAPKAFVLSISQANEKYNALTWNYLICINSADNCFFFQQETQLQTIFFPSFQQLIADERIRAVIPLTEIVPYSIKFDDEIWKIPFEQLTIEEKIGEGQFGVVSRAKWRKGGRTLPIAVKKLRRSAVTSTAKDEIEAMKNLTNLFIVSLYGVSHVPETNEILIVTELLENGDLKSWLQRLPTLPEYATLVRFAKDIASGMAFIESRNYVHRDLACRNILIGPCAYRVKIADFGLSTILNVADADRRQEAQTQRLPARSLAPELIDNRADYSIKSDVWAYGILLVELWQKGADPYGNEHPVWILGAVRVGHVHERPAACPENFYETLICRCLQFQAADRPSFSTLRQLLEKWQCT